MVGDSRTFDLSLPIRPDLLPMFALQVIGSPGWVFLHYEAMQLILRKQVEVLTVEMGLPAELELVVRDLWLLHVTQSGVKFGDTEAAAEEEPGDSEEETNEAASLVRETIRESTQDPSIKHSEGEEDAEGKDAVPKKKFRTLPKRDREATRMSATVALLYLACRWLRLPVMMADLHA